MVLPPTKRKMMVTVVYVCCKHKLDPSNHIPNNPDRHISLNYIFLPHNLFHVPYSGPSLNWLYPAADLVIWHSLISIDMAMMKIARNNTTLGPISHVFRELDFCLSLSNVGTAGNVFRPDDIDCWPPQAVGLDGFIRVDRLAMAAHILCGIRAKFIDTNYSDPEKNTLTVSRIFMVSYWNNTHISCTEIIIIRYISYYNTPMLHFGPYVTFQSCVRHFSAQCTSLFSPLYVTFQPCGCAHFGQRPSVWQKQ